MASAKKNKQRQSSKGGQSKSQAARAAGAAAASRAGKPDKAGKDGKSKAGLGSRWSRSRDRARQTQASKGTQKSERGLRRFIRDVRIELRKVTWPSRKDLFQSTLVVLVAVAISGAFIAALDFIFSRLTSYLP